MDCTAIKFQMRNISLTFVISSVSASGIAALGARICEGAIIERHLNLKGLTETPQNKCDYVGNSYSLRMLGNYTYSALSQMKLVGVYRCNWIGIWAPDRMSITHCSHWM